MVNEPSNINPNNQIKPTYFAGVPKKLPQKENSAKKQTREDAFLKKIFDDSFLTDENNYKLDYKNFLISIWQYILSLLRNIKNFVMNMLKNIANFINAK